MRGLSPRMQSHVADVLRSDSDALDDTGWPVGELEEVASGIRGSLQVLSEKRRQESFGDIPDATAVFYVNGKPDIQLADVLSVRHRGEAESAARRFKVLGPPRDMGGRGHRVSAVPLKLYDPNQAVGGGS